MEKKCNKPYSKGEIIEMEITDLTDEGRGVGKVDGFTFFVKGGVYGEKVKARVTKVKKRFGFAEKTETIKESPYMAEFSCSYQGDCGGCPLGKISYEGQLKLKEKQVRDKIERLGGVDEPVIGQIVSMETPWRYRSKASLAVARDAEYNEFGHVTLTGSPEVGFYRRGTMDVIDCEDCAIQAETVRVCAKALRIYMEEDNITAYNPKNGKGLLRHMVVRTAFGTREVMVILVINGKGIPGEEKLVRLLDNAISEIGYSLESVIINIDRESETQEKINGIYGNKGFTLAGSDTISEVSEDMVYEISPFSFYQVNPVITEKVYEKAMEYGKITGGETVLDLYCGVGTLGLCAAKRGAGKVIGIESVHEAILNANRNCVINGIVDARYAEGKAEDILPQLMAGEGPAEKDSWLAVEKADVIFIDPPRKGCDEQLLEAASKANPDRIVYVSCDPATLARDIRILGEKGYGLVEITPFDMFPHTGHVETVVLMSRVDK